MQWSIICDSLIIHTATVVAVTTFTELWFDESRAGVDLALFWYGTGGAQFFSANGRQNIYNIGRGLYKIKN